MPTGQVPRHRAKLVFDARATRGEGPLWDARDQRLLWVDIDAGVVHRFDPASGIDEPTAVGQPVGAAALREAGGLVLAVRDGFSILDDGHSTVIADVEREDPASRMNDGSVDLAGRFWAGTMAFDASVGAGSLYRLDPDGAVQTMLTGLTISNGLDWSPEDRTMYFVDSMAGGVDAFDFDLDAGTISGRRRVCEIPPEEGLPDGLTVDADGFVWVALWGSGSVRCYAPSGALVALVDVPARQVTSCAFGGPDLADLYITTARAGLSAEDLRGQPDAGGLFVCRPGVVGRAPNVFRG